MTGHVRVWRTPSTAVPWWEVLCPCCADRKPGVAILAAFGTWRRAFDYAYAHARTRH